MIITVTSPPATMPVTYEQIAAHCRVTTDRERDLMLAYIAQATEYAEQAMEMSLVIRTINARFHAGEDLRLPRGPVTEIVSVKDDSGSDVAGRHCRVGNSDRIETAFAQAGRQRQCHPSGLPGLGGAGSVLGRQRHADDGVR
ncbi:MAG TPA: head-tail connector protein [Tepidisphaeraceae bacterium]|jgi:hypothetical protein